jgi:hypothetical protein
MKLKQSLYALLGGWALLSANCAFAQETRDVYVPTVERTYLRAIGDAEHAFYRKQSYMGPSTGLRQAAPASLSDLTAYGFLPSNPAYALSLTAVDSTHSKLCLEMRVTSETLWKAAARLLESPNVSRADASCNVIAATPVKAVWPVKLYAIKILDTEDAMARTLVPTSPVISGIDKRVITLPALTLPAPPGQWGTAASVNVTNPAAIALPGQPAAPSLSIVKSTVRSGFRAQHNCTQVAAQQSCTVSVQYFGNLAQESLVGNLRLDFSNGSFMTVSLLGKRGNGIPIITTVLDTVGAVLPSGSTTAPTGGTSSGTTGGTTGSTTGGTTGGTTTPSTSSKCYDVWVLWWKFLYCPK